MTRVMEPTLFRRILTDDLVEEVRGICASTGGQVRVLPDAHYLVREDEALDRLRGAGIHICSTPDGRAYERAGYCRHTPYHPDRVLQPDSAPLRIAELLDQQTR